jgi:hypothetical protein
MLSLSCIVEGFLTTHARIQALGVSLRSRRAFWQATLVFFLDRAKPETPVPKPHIRTRHSSPCLKAGVFWLGSVNRLHFSSPLRAARLRALRADEPDPARTPSSAMRPPAWSEARRGVSGCRACSGLLPRKIPLKTAPYLSSRVASLRGKETSLLVRLRDGWTCSKSHFLLVFSIPFSTLALRRSTRCRWLRQLPCFCAKDSTATRLGTSPKGGDGPR